MKKWQIKKIGFGEYLMKLVQYRKPTRPILSKFLYKTGYVWKAESPDKKQCFFAVAKKPLQERVAYIEAEKMREEGR